MSLAETMFKVWSGTFSWLHSKLSWFPGVMQDSILLVIFSVSRGSSLEICFKSCSNVCTYCSVNSQSSYTVKPANEIISEQFIYKGACMFICLCSSTLLHPLCCCKVVFVESIWKCCQPWSSIVYLFVVVAVLDCYEQ